MAEHPTYGSRWRHQLAKKLIQPYLNHPQIEAIILGGSTARGHADPYSDIEIGMFWSRPPEDEERDTLAQQSDGNILRISPFLPQEQVWCDDLMVGANTAVDENSGVLVEIVHHTTDHIEETLADVLTNHNPDLLKQNLLAGILESIPLQPSGSLTNWQQQISNYPDGLAEAVIRRHAQIDHFWRWQMWLSRGPNLMRLNQQFVQVEEKVLHTLLGINRQYYAGFKWLDQVVNRMTIKPPDLLARLRSVHTLPPQEGAVVLAALVEDVYSLLEVHLPSIDVAWLRRVFHYQRHPWQSQPPG